jgi:hypothetical protein
LTAVEVLSIFKEEDVVNGRDPYLLKRMSR